MIKKEILCKTGECEEFIIPLTAPMSTGWEDANMSPIADGDIIKWKGGRISIVLWEDYRAGFKAFNMPKLYANKYALAHPRKKKNGEDIEEAEPMRGTAITPDLLEFSEVEVIDNYKNFYDYVKIKNDWKIGD